MNNYLDLENLIIERLTAELPKEVKVLSSADLEGLKTSAQPAPAVHVLLEDDQPASEVNTSQQIKQRWCCILVVKNVRTVRTGQAARTDAGLLIPQIITILNNWEPQGAIPYYPLTRVKTAFKPRYSNGFMHYPLTFECSFHWKNDYGLS